MNIDFMRMALDVAKKSGSDVPVGAVLVKDGKPIAVSCNKKEKNLDVTAHAEILVIKKTEKLLNTFRLNDCDLYVTLEPCPMCAWTIIQSKIRNCYFGAYDSLYGALGSKIDLRKLANSKLMVKGGILEDECNNLIKGFFKELR